MEIGCWGEQKRKGGGFCFTFLKARLKKGEFQSNFIEDDKKGKKTHPISQLAKIPPLIEHISTIEHGQTAAGK